VAWSARSHLASVWRAARSGPCADDADEIMAYRTAVVGFCACVLLSAAWLSALGMTYLYALFQLIILFLVIAIVMARSTGECGMLMTESSFRPIDVYRLVGDARNLGGANLTAGSFLDALWMRDQRGLVLTGFLDATRLGDGVRIKRRSLVGVFTLAIVVAVLVGGYLHLVLPYRIGGLSMYYYVYQGNARRVFVDTRAVMNRAAPFPQSFAQLHFGIGVVFTLLLVVARARLAWFPLHPMGFALCTTWTMTVFWFACLVAWLCKVLILRYGGMRLYTRARPFFLGMVLGEFTMALLWTIPSIFWRTPTPFFPWP